MDSYRRLPRRKGFPRYLVMAVTVSKQNGPKPVSLNLPEGMPYNIDLIVTRRQLLTDGEEKYPVKRAPASWLFRTGPLLPQVQIRFEDAYGKALAPQSGLWAVEDNRRSTTYERFEKKNPLSLPFVAFKDNQKYRVQITTEEGDFKNWDLEFGKERNDLTLRLVRQGKREGRVLQIPEAMAKQGGLQMVAELEDGAQRSCKDLLRFPWMHKRPLPGFLPLQGKLRVIPNPKLPHKKLWLIDHAGRLAFHDTKESEASKFKMWPATELVEFDLPAIHKAKLCRAGAQFELIYVLKDGMHMLVKHMRVDKEGGGRWGSLPSFYLPKGMDWFLRMREDHHNAPWVRVELPTKKR